VQETFLVGIRSLENFAGRSSERSWLVGILKNKILDYWRTAHRETPFTDMRFLADKGSQSLDADACWNCLNKLRQWRIEAEEVTHKTEFWQTLRDSLSKLPRRHSIVFMLREIDCTSTKEICRAVSISEENFWVMLHRARIALRESFETNWFGKQSTKSVCRQGINSCVRQVQQNGDQVRVGERARLIHPAAAGPRARLRQPEPPSERARALTASQSNRFS
jgi:RNA polymerase sigma-70 factor (ECF subfamily)